jgi:hypothetical protein
MGMGFGDREPVKLGDVGRPSYKNRVIISVSRLQFEIFF